MMKVDEQSTLDITEFKNYILLVNRDIYKRIKALSDECKRDDIDMSVNEIADMLLRDALDRAEEAERSEVE